MGSADANDPAMFYLVSYPAHAEYPTVHIMRSNAEETMLGSRETASLRRLRKYIRPGVVESASHPTDRVNAQSRLVEFGIIALNLKDVPPHAGFVPIVDAYPRDVTSAEAKTPGVP